MHVTLKVREEPQHWKLKNFHWIIDQEVPVYYNNIIIIIIIIDMNVSCHKFFFPGTSLEPAVIPTAQASSFTLQYFPYYVWCSKYSCLL